MFEYIQRIRLHARKLQQFKIALPGEVGSWLLLRRAGLNEEQKTLVMSQVGMNIMLELKLLDALRCHGRRKKRGAAEL